MCGAASLPLRCRGFCRPCDGSRRPHLPRGRHAHPLARPHVGVAYSGLMGDLKVNDLPEIDDALYLKHEHEYTPLR